MILKTSEEIIKMREAGLILWDVHQAAAQALCEGVTTKEVDKVVEERISRLGALPLFKGVPGRVPFPACTCISVNEEVVHGIPKERVIVSGDIVSIDIGVKYNGFCADSAVTIPVGDVSETKMTLLKVTEESLCMAISMLAPGISWNKIAKVMQKMIESAGYSIVRELVGHGIGREMWEPPQVPNYYVRKEHSFTIQKGATLAIEPMVNMGKKEIRLAKDHWTIFTKDLMPSAHFEHTVAITENGPFVLTCGPEGQGWAMPENALFRI